MTIPPCTPADLLRYLTEVLTVRGYAPVIHPRDLPLAHDAARALLQAFGVLPWTSVTDPHNVRLEEVDE